MEQRMPIMERLRKETRSLHLQLEKLPYFEALAATALPQESYVAQLKAMRIVYGEFEHEISATNHPLVAAIWDERMSKLSLIEKDLRYFEADKMPDIPNSLLNALVVAEDIRYRNAKSPVSLLGYFYVLEGSTLGGVVVRSQVARNFALSGSGGLAFLSSYEKWIKANWKRFTQRMNDLIVDFPAHTQIVEAACEAFEGIKRVYQALYPPKSKKFSHLVSSLNPDAGYHAIPNDLREIRAALTAGGITWRQFPYFEWRYGERGKRFTRSDSTWIVTLVQYPQEGVCEKIKWLGRVLSSRGMPQWLLENHLRNLHNELTRAIPEKHQVYDKLLHAADMLLDIRNKHITAARFRSLSAEFEASADREWSSRLPRSGRLLVAAVADEKSGIENAVTSVESWMTDPSRFPPIWIEAVRKTIRQARGKAK